MDKIILVYKITYHVNRYSIEWIAYAVSSSIQLERFFHSPWYIFCQCIHFNRHRCCHPSKVAYFSIDCIHWIIECSTRAYDTSDKMLDLLLCVTRVFIVTYEIGHDSVRLRLHVEYYWIEYEDRKATSSRVRSSNRDIRVELPLIFKLREPFILGQILVILSLFLMKLKTGQDRRCDGRVVRIYSIYNVK